MRPLRSKLRPSEERMTMAGKALDIDHAWKQALGARSCS
jgi:hypothetical protein